MFRTYEDEMAYDREGDILRALERLHLIELEEQKQQDIERLDSDE